MKQIMMILTMLAFYGCASQTDYTPASNERGYGYTESRITENRYRVNFRGNSRTSSNDVKDMALLRAAEITLLNDYDWFRIVNQDTLQSLSTSPQTQSRLSSGRRVYQNCGLLGCTTSVSPAYRSIEVVTQGETDSYTTTIEIVMGKGELSDQTSAYNATELRSNLQAKF